MPIDYSKYPPNWKTEIVPAIRERSGNRCEGDACTGFQGEGRCNAPNGRWIVRNEERPWEWQTAIEPESVEGSVLVVLTTAHLDHDEENHAVSLDRLRHLCQRCHLRYDAAEKVIRMRAKRDAAAGQLQIEGIAV